MEEYITACPRNCYSTCTFRVKVEDNTVKEILPYSGNRSTPEGPCIKGLSYIERIKSSERIIHPLKRLPDGSFEKISMPDALDIISGKLAEIKSEYGPQSILWYKGSGMSGLSNETGSIFWRAFGGATTTYGNLCWPAGLEAVRLTLGSVKHNVPWDLPNSRVIVLWGKNSAETNIQEIAFIADARSAGCRVICIDPVRTPTADKADILLSPRPGTDAALALAAAKVIVDEGLENGDFIHRHVIGFREFRNSLDITPEKAEVITGIPADTIIWLARTIANSGPVTFIPGYGLQRHSNGGQTIRCILSLAVITGNLGKPGAGFNYANLQSYIYDHPKEPLSYYPDPVIDPPLRREIPMALLGKGILETKNPEIKAAWVERGNPVLQVPDSVSVRKAFDNLLFRVVVEQFMTDTASLADIILPAKEMFEQPDIIGSYWSPYIQFMPGIIASPGEVMTETEIYYHLAEKLGLKADLPAPGNRNMEEWLEKRISKDSLLKLSDLKKGPVIAPGLQEIAWEDMKFETGSGKIELYSSEAASRWGVSPLPEYVPVIDGNNKKFPLKLLTPNMGSRIHSQFGNLRIIRDAFPGPSAIISCADAENRNIREGENIKIFSCSGCLSTVVKISGRVPEGIIILPNGIWLNEGGGGNILIEGRETDMGFGTVFHDTWVEIEKTS